MMKKSKLILEEAQETKKIGSEFLGKAKNQAVLKVYDGIMSTAPNLARMLNHLDYLNLIH